MLPVGAAPVLINIRSSVQTWTLRSGSNSWSNNKKCRISINSCATDSQIVSYFYIVPALTADTQPFICVCNWGGCRWWEHHVVELWTGTGSYSGLVQTSRWDLVGSVFAAWCWENTSWSSFSHHLVHPSLLGLNTHGYWGQSRVWFYSMLQWFTAAEALRGDEDE